MNYFLKDYFNNDKSISAISLPFQHYAGDFLLVGLITLKSKVPYDTYQAAKFISNGIIDHFTYFDGQPLENLKSATGVAKDLLLNLMKNEEEFSDGNGLEFHLSICSLKGDTLYFAITEESGLGIIHEDEYIGITELLNKNNVTAGSTNISDQDTIFLAAPDLNRTVVDKQAKINDFLTFHTEVSELMKLIEGQEGGIVISPGLDFDKQIKKAAEVIVVVNEAPIKEIVEAESEEAIEEVGVNPYLDFEESTGVSQFSTAKVEKNAIIEEKVSNEDLIDDAVVETFAEKAKKKINIGNLKSSVGSAKGIATKIWKKAYPILDKSSELSSKAVEKFSNTMNSSLNQKYGRKPWFRKMQSRISQMKMRSGVNNTYIGDYRQKEQRIKRFSFILAGIFAIALVTISYNAIRSYQEKRAVAVLMENHITEISTILDEAKNNVRGNSALVNQSLILAQGKIENLPVESDQVNDEHKAKLAELDQQVLGLSDDINRITVLTDAVIERVVDGRIDLGNNSNPTDLAIYKSPAQQEVLYISDAGTNKIYEITLSNNEIKSFDTEGGFKSPMFVAAGSTGVFVFDSTLGVLKAPFSDDGGRLAGDFVKLNALTPQSFNGTLDDFTVLPASENLYGLSRERQILYKVQAYGASYGLPFEYLNSTYLSGAQDVFADFNIYVTSSNMPGVKQFSLDTTTSKLKDSGITVGGIQSTITKPAAAYSNGSNSNNAYIYDAALNRVMLYEKPNFDLGLHPTQIVLTKQYEYRGKDKAVFGDVKDIVVNSVDSHLYLLSGSNLYKIAL